MFSRKRNVVALMATMLLSGHSAMAASQSSLLYRFNKDSSVQGWQFILPWNSTDKTTDYSVGNGYLELKMLSTDKGASVLSPKFSLKGKLTIAVRHYMHQEANPFLGNIELRDETSEPSAYASAERHNIIHIGFQNSSYTPDYACSAYNIPRVQDTEGCVPKVSASATTSSSLYDKWITTVIKYNPASGFLSVDYENDGKVDFVGRLEKGNRFVPTRIAFNGFGWYTGHYHRIATVKITAK